MAKKVVKVILVDDHRLLRQGMRALLEKEAGLVLLGDCGTAADARVLIAARNPDVIVMDISLPDMSGIDLAREIKLKYPVIKVLALSMHDERQFIRRMLAAGASGYLIKDNAFEEVVEAVKKVAQGGIYLSRDLTETIVQDYANNVASAAEKKIDSLSKREREILTSIAGGRRTKEIAVDLCISVNTVDTHRKNIMEKLGVVNPTQLLKLAIKEGLTSLDD